MFFSWFLVYRDYTEDSRPSISSFRSLYGSLSYFCEKNTEKLCCCALPGNVKGNAKTEIDNACTGMPFWAMKNVFGAFCFPLCAKNVVVQWRVCFLAKRTWRAKKTHPHLPHLSTPSFHWATLHEVGFWRLRRNFLMKTTVHKNLSSGSKKSLSHLCIQLIFTTSSFPPCFMQLSPVLRINFWTAKSYFMRSNKFLKGNIQGTSPNLATGNDPDFPGLDLFHLHPVCFCSKFDAWSMSRIYVHACSCMKKCHCLPTKIVLEEVRKKKKKQWQTDCHRRYTVDWNDIIQAEHLRFRVWVINPKTDYSHNRCLIRRNVCVWPNHCLGQLVPRTLLPRPLFWNYCSEIYAMGYSVTAWLYRQVWN